MGKSSTAGRFDFGGSMPSSGTGTIKELLAELNQERELAEKANAHGKAANGVLVGINSLTTTLKGIERITGRKIPKSEISQVSVSDLKTVKRLYLTGLEHWVKVFTIIDPPQLRGDEWTLEFRESVPAPRNKIATLAIQDLLTRFAIDVPSDRRETIERALPQLSELLLQIEDENAHIGRILKHGFRDDMDAVTSAYQELTAWVDGYPVTTSPSSNPLDEAVYTYLRTLRCAHFAIGFKKAFELAEIKDAIEPIADHMDLLACAVSTRVGQPLQLATPFRGEAHEVGKPAGSPSVLTRLCSFSLSWRSFDRFRAPHRTKRRSSSLDPPCTLAGSKTSMSPLSRTTFRPCA